MTGAVSGGASAGSGRGCSITAFMSQPRTYPTAFAIESFNRRSIPLKDALAPGVEIRNEQNQSEDEDFNEQERCEGRSAVFCDLMGKDRGPWIEEDDFD